MCSSRIVVTILTLDPEVVGSSPEWVPIFYEARSLHRAYPSLHPFGVVHWVPEQLNIKAVTGACKLIDGCSLKSCVRPHLQWHHLAYATE